MRPDILAAEVARRIRGVLEPLAARVKMLESIVAGRDAALTLGNRFDELAAAQRAIRDQLVARDSVVDNVADLVGTLLKTLDKLTKQVAVLETRQAPGLVYCGQHELGKSYDPGAIVYTGGSSWVAVTTTTASPSTASKDWGLLASRGRDGKREPRP